MGTLRFTPKQWNSHQTAPFGIWWTLASLHCNPRICRALQHLTIQPDSLEPSLHCRSHSRACAAQMQFARGRHDLVITAAAIVYAIHKSASKCHYTVTWQQRNQVQRMHGTSQNSSHLYEGRFWTENTRVYFQNFPPISPGLPWGSLHPLHY